MGTGQNTKCLKISQIPALLANQGIRPTRQRLALASYLFEGQHKHVTADDIVVAMNKSHAHVSVATVYNNLHHFTKAGLLRQISVDQNCCYFDTNTTIHGHYFDEVTGEVYDIPESDLEMMHMPAAPAGRQIRRVDITIRLSKAT